MYGVDTYLDAWCYALAAHEYYWGDGHTQIMSDEEYDALTRILRINWADIPLELQELFIEPKRLGQGSTHIKLTDEQKSYAYLQLERVKEIQC